MKGRSLLFQFSSIRSTQWQLCMIQEHQLQDWHQAANCKSGEAVAAAHSSMSNERFLEHFDFTSDSLAEVYKDHCTW